MKQKAVQVLSIALFVGLLVWGGFSTLSYFGVPVHGAVLLTEGALQTVENTCGSGNLLCRGVAGFFPAIVHTIGRAAPFAWYAVLCLLAYVLFLGWRAVKNGEFRLRLTVRPWQLIVLFLGMVWLLFTTFGAGTNDGMPVNQIVEPTEKVYANVEKDVLTELKNNFNSLKDAHCLTLLGQADNGASVYKMSAFCMQKSFVIRVLPPFLVVLAFLFELLVLGRFLLRLFRARTPGFLAETVLSIGLGAGGWIAILWLFAILSIFTQPFGWALVLALPIILYRQSWYWLKRLFGTTVEVNYSWHAVTVVLSWLLLSYLALNFLTVVRPFPIGWDDLGSYLNRPRLLVSYGHFIFSMATFQWEYVTALGFLLFGYASTLGATSSMMINWTAGLIAVLSVLLFARTYLGKGKGVLSALLFYSLPLIGHFSYADMKIDNAVFFAGALSMYCVFLYLFPPEDGAEEQAAAPAEIAPGWRAFVPRNWQWAAIAGLFAGLAFGFKITTVMVMLSLVVALLGVAHWSALVSGLFLILYALIAQRALNVQGIASRVGLSVNGAFVHALPWVLLAVAAVFFLVAVLKRRRGILPGIGGFVIFGLFGALAIAPWNTYNNFQRGSLIPRLATGVPNTLSPILDYKGNGGYAAGQHVRTLPADLKLDPKNPACTPTGGTEELDRYWGFGKGWAHYLTLPWRTVLNLDSAGYYVTTMPGLLLFPLLLLLPYFWMKRGRWLRWLFIATGAILVQWMFLANGIPWYGVGVFLGLVIALEALLDRAPDPLNKAAMWVLIFLTLVVTFANRLWQFEQQRNLLEYPLGKISAQALETRTIPYYQPISDIVTERFQSMPDRPYLYRAGTFIPYFIPKNLEVIGVTDNQLDTFNCLNQEHNPELTLKRLKALGFNSIIFDTNTATIEQDQNGSLHKKVQDFVDFLNTPSLRLKIVVNDPAQGVAFILLP
jgi:hypothetical protein